MSEPDLRELKRHGLRYSSDEEPGIERRKRGSGFAYRTADGKPITAADRARIKQLVIPPAWTDVWISADELGHVQATGRDARGRKQYRYHDEWRAMRDQRKFEDLAHYGDALSTLRKQIDSDLARRTFDHRKMVALVLALMDTTLIRVGNAEYARTNGSFGLTTLTRRHVVIDGGELRLRFVGKSGVRHDVEVDDPRLARLVRRCHELGGRELFGFTDPDGTTVTVDSGDANDYLREVVGDQHTVKTFRTWGASSLVVDHLATIPAPDASEIGQRELIAAIDRVAARLGNTRTVARAMYVHPSIPDWVDDGSLHDAWRSTRSTSTMERSERALLRLLSG